MSDKIVFYVSSKSLTVHSPVAMFVDRSCCTVDLSDSALLAADGKILSRVSGSYLYSVAESER